MNARHLVLAGLAVILLVPLGCGLERPSAPGQSRFTASGQASKPATGSAAGKPADVSTQTVPPAQPEGQRVQRSAQITLEVANGSFEKSLDRVVNLMRGQGGYVSGSDAQADSGGRLRSGEVVFQIPADRFDATISGLRQLGTAQSIRITGTDVSTQYVDLQARLRNAEAQRDAMLALLQQAKSVSDVIQIQTQLGQITGQIEQLKGQIDYLDHTTAFATVAVTLREAAAATGVDEWGLRTAAAQALHNFVNGIGLMLEVLGAIAPLLPLGLIGWLVVRRLRRRPPAQTAA
jgi:Domain of unknown function (DUF4349)